MQLQVHCASGGSEGYTEQVCSWAGNAITQACHPSICQGQRRGGGIYKDSAALAGQHTFARQSRAWRHPGACSKSPKCSSKLCHRVTLTLLPPASGSMLLAATLILLAGAYSPEPEAEALQQLWSLGVGASKAEPDPGACSTKPEAGALQQPLSQGVVLGKASQADIPAYSQSAMPGSWLLYAARRHVNTSVLVVT